MIGLPRRESATTARRCFTCIESHAPSDAPSMGVQGGNGPRPLLVIRVRGRAIVVDAASIERIDGAGNYIRFHLGNGGHRVRGTLKELQKILPPQFVRSHRSTILNVAAIQEFKRTPCGDLIAVLRSGARQTVSRTRRRSVEAALGVTR